MTNCSVSASILGLTSSMNGMVGAEGSLLSIMVPELESTSKMPQFYAVFTGWFQGPDWNRKYFLGNLVV